VSRTTLLRSPLTEGLAELYGLHTDPVIADSLRRGHAVWEGLAFSDGTPARVPYEVLPDVSRPALLASGAESETDLDLLYRYAFGAWENRWNVFDLTGAFARVTTDQAVDLSFVDRSMATAVRADTQVGVGAAAGDPTDRGLGLAEHQWYGEFLRGLRDAAVEGTAGGLAQRWRSEGLSGELFAKTGTLAETEARGGSGLFIKSLLFSVGESGEQGFGALRCGIVGSVYLSFSQGPRRGSLPSYQLDFARRRLGEILAEEWEKAGVCPSLEVDRTG